MKYVIAFVAAAGLGFVALGACGGGGADCDAAKTGYDACYGTGGAAIKTACEAENTAGVCTRTKYYACFADITCTDTNDSDNQTKMSTCISDNAACE